MLAKHPTALAACLLVLVLHVCFLPFLWGTRTLLASARGTPNVPSVMPNGSYYGPPQGPAFFRANDEGASAWVTEADAPLVRYQYLRENSLPLWNPYQAYGAPLAADMQSQPFNPLFVLYSLHPGPWTFNLFVLARLFVAGFCAYLYVRLFAPFVPALAGGIVCMLCGYYILFFNMPHLSVETLTPALFLTIERLLRRQSGANLLLATTMVFLTIAGGMPESTVLLLAFGGAYLIFRVASDPALRKNAIRHAGNFALAAVLGTGLAAFLIAPFVEFMRVAWDLHQAAHLHGSITGLRHDAPGISIFTYVTPLLFGAAWSGISPHLGGYNALRGYFGILPVFLVMAAVAAARSKRLIIPEQRKLILFFGAAGAIFLLKRYGAPVINWLGYLPLFRLVWFPKYDEPLLAFAVAVLAGFGLDYLLSGGMTRRERETIALGAFALVGCAFVFSLPTILAAKVAAHVFYLSLGLTVALLFVAMLMALGGHPGPRLGAYMVMLLVGEMAGNYIFPVYYALTQSATAEANPYRGAPYVDFLKATAGEMRVFGMDGILHPGWASAFQIADIRGLDAMYWKKYLPFVQAFLGAGLQHDRVTGTGSEALSTLLGRRLLQLSSAKYVASMQPLALDSSLAGEIVRQNQGRLAAGRENLIELRRFTINGQTEAVLYEHPLYERLPFAVAITPERRRFSFDLAMHPAVYDKSTPVCGDGVEFRLEVRDATGGITPLLRRYIDPKHNVAERRWIPESVDLSRYNGQTVDLLFTTTPGPAGNSCMDWAGWGAPRFDGEPENGKPLRLVYDREVKIYEYADVLPRAAIFTQAEVAADDARALTRLQSPGMDVLQSAVISGNGLDEQQKARLHAMTGAGQRAQAAKIVSYRSQKVQIAAACPADCLLVLNDADYPGWNAYVDGQRATWMTADYLFRGVLLNGGKHSVVFAYQPASFRWGAGIAALSLLGLAAAVWKTERAR